MKKSALTVAGMLIPLSATAHPGHDHSHWTSSLAHGILFVGIMAVAALGIKLLNKNANTKNINTEEE